MHADAAGNYGISLAPGTYVVATAKTGMGYISKDLPDTITIQSGKTATLDISVDNRHSLICHCEEHIHFVQCKLRDVAI